LIQAREIYASLPETEPRKIGMSDFYLGKIGFSKRSFRRSAEYLTSALDYFERGEEKDKSPRLITLALLVQALESVGKSDEATKYCVAIGKESPLSPDQEYLPLFRMAPQYPGDMLSAGKEGFVDVEFTVDEQGFVRNPGVVNRFVNGKKRSRVTSFDKAALDAVAGFRYAPRFENGEAVVAEGVTTRISFMLE
jgi:TonB family protein